MVWRTPLPPSKDWCWVAGHRAFCHDCLLLLLPALLLRTARNGCCGLASTHTVVLSRWREGSLVQRMERSLELSAEAASRGGKEAASAGRREHRQREQGIPNTKQ
jgi:hypothetical protein